MTVIPKKMIDFPPCIHEAKITCCSYHRNLYKLRGEKVAKLQAELEACKGNLILMTDDRDKWLNQTIEDSAEIARLEDEIEQLKQERW